MDSIIGSKVLSDIHCAAYGRNKAILCHVELVVPGDCNIGVPTLSLGGGLPLSPALTFLSWLHFLASHSILLQLWEHILPSSSLVEVNSWPLFQQPLWKVSWHCTGSSWVTRLLLNKSLGQKDCDVPVSLAWVFLFLESVVESTPPEVLGLTLGKVYQSQGKNSGNWTKKVIWFLLYAVTECIPELSKCS